MMIHTNLSIACCLDPTLEEGVRLLTGSQGEDIFEFAAKHLLKDWQFLNVLVGRNAEDTAILVHSVCNTLDGETDATLTGAGSNVERSQIEQNFQNAHISRFIEDIDVSVKNYYKNYEEDLSVLGELRETIDISEIKEKDVVNRRLFTLWRYRKQASIEHLGSQFNLKPSTKELHPILNLFIAESEQILSLQYLIDCIEFQSLLSQKFDKKIDREYARATTVGDVLDSLATDEKRRWETVFEGFQNAWNSAWKYVDRYTCMEIPDDWKSVVMTRNTTLSFCMASERDEGICTLALLNFMADKHNQLYEMYQSKLYSKFEFKIPSRMMKPTHAVQYKPAEFLPYLQRQCEQDLSYGTGGKVTYDYERTEQWLLDTILSGKPQLDLEVKQFEFANEARITGSLSVLGSKIKQEKLPEDLVEKILKESSSLQQLNSVKRILEIAIGFLSATGGTHVVKLPGEEYFGNYIRNTLLLEDELLEVGNTVRDQVQLKHLISLWELLEAKLHPDVFENVLPQYRTELDDNLYRDLEEVVPYMDLEILLPILKSTILSYFSEGGGAIGISTLIKDTLAWTMTEKGDYLGDLQWFKSYFLNTLSVDTF
jgi:hypothetical protein